MTAGADGYRLRAGPACAKLLEIVHRVGRAHGVRSTGWMADRDGDPEPGALIASAFGFPHLGQPAEQPTMAALGRSPPLRIT
jgi:hypothetical protein